MMEPPTADLPTERWQLDSDDDMSDEQIHALLKEAEARLRTTTTLATGDTVPHFHLPKFNVEKVGNHYVHEIKGIALADKQKLLNEQQRALANHVRKVEDPVAVKKKKLEEKKATAGSDWYNMPKTGTLHQCFVSFIS